MSDSVRVYCDYNASAPMRDCVRSAVLEALDMFSVHGMNGSSLHYEGRLCRSYIDDARLAVKDFALSGSDNGDDYDVVFTSGGTESCNMVLRGFPCDVVLCSAVEHAAVLATADSLACGVMTLPVDGSGVLDLNFLEQSVRDVSARGRSFLVCVMFANNETGVLQPVSEVCDIVHRYGGYIFVDCAQAKSPFDMSSWGESGADFISLSSHKLGGCSGSGAVIYRQSLDFTSLLTGGGQEGRLRSGTENVVSIIGFSAALSGMDAHESAHVLSLRDALEQGLRSTCPDVRIFSDSALRLNNTSCFALRGLESDIALMSLDLAGFSVSAGSACSSGRLSPSHVLSAMGVGEDLASCALRVSLGWGNEMSDVELFVAAWSRLVSGDRDALHKIASVSAA